MLWRIKKKLSINGTECGEAGGQPQAAMREPADRETKITAKDPKRSEGPAS